jgi:hypothetical protein
MCVAGQSTYDNIADALSVLDTKVHKHVLRIPNTSNYCCLLTLADYHET